MFGGIQRLIGLANSQLEQFIEQAEALLKTKVTVESDLDGEVSEADYFINRLSTNSLLLERCNRDWSNVIEDTKGEGKAIKECEYAQATEGEDSFIELMLTANDMIARPKARVMLISRKRESNDRIRAVTSTQNELQPIIEQITQITCVTNQSTHSHSSQVLV